MNSLNSMVSKLKPLGLYNLDSDSLVYKEIYSYSYGLKIIEDLLDELERECFINTAIDYGLDNREKTFGYVDQGLSTESRRKFLICNNSVTRNDFTKADIEYLLRIYGIDSYIIEVPNDSTIHINVLSVTNSVLSKSEVLNRIQAYLPAHLNCIFDFRELQWQQIDDMDLTFTQMDNKNLTWNEIDNYEQ